MTVLIVGKDSIGGVISSDGDFGENRISVLSVYVGWIWDF